MVQFYEEDLFNFKGEFIAAQNGGMLPTQNHQINEEIVKLEKEFAGLIYFERDQIKYEQR